MYPQTFCDGYHLQILFYVHRETEGDNYNEKEIDEAMSSEQIPSQDNSDHSETEENAVLDEYDLDNYDEDGEGKGVPPEFPNSHQLTFTLHPNLSLFFITM